MGSRAKKCSMVTLEFERFNDPERLWISWGVKKGEWVLKRTNKRKFSYFREKVLAENKFGMR